MAYITTRNIALSATGELIYISDVNYLIIRRKDEENIDLRTGRFRTDSIRLRFIHGRKSGKWNANGQKQWEYAYGKQRHDDSHTGQYGVDR